MRLFPKEFGDFHRASVDRFVTEAAKKVPSDAIVIDAGSGEGVYRSLFSHAVYLGFDYAIGDPAWDYSGLDCICDLHTIPVQDNRIPYALCTQTLEHVTRPSLVISELYRILKPGGLAFCSMPFLGDAHHQEPHDFYRYTKYAVEFLFLSAGFRDLVVEPFGGYYTLVISLIQKRLIRWYEARTRMMLPLRLFVPGIVRALIVASRLAGRLAWRIDQRDPDRYQYALGFGVTARK